MFKVVKSHIRELNDHWFPREVARNEKNCVQRIVMSSRTVREIVSKLVLQAL